MAEQSFVLYSTEHTLTVESGRSVLSIKFDFKIVPVYAPSAQFRYIF